jgi:hypothetical protein
VRSRSSARYGRARTGLSSGRKKKSSHDKHDASGADGGNDVAPAVADLLAGPSAKLSDTKINGCGGVAVQGLRDEPALACTSTCRPLQWRRWTDLRWPLLRRGRRYGQ